MELVIRCTDTDKHLWEAKIYTADKPWNTNTVGGNGKVWRLDEADGLIALILKKIDRVWPDVTFTKITCRIDGDSGAAQYVAKVVRERLATK